MTVHPLLITARFSQIYAAKSATPAPSKQSSGNNLPGQIRELEERIEPHGSFGRWCVAITYVLG